MRPFIILQLAMLLWITLPAYSQVEAPSGNTGSLNDDKNWIISKTFDENGNVINEKKEFYDNTGKLLQTQSKLKYRKDASTVYTHVFAEQPIKDVFGRNALSTLAAPIDNSQFIYKSDFVRNGSGTAYTYKNFDRYVSGGTPTTKVVSPDPLGGQSVKGTLAWYYSNNNTWEPYTATTNYPYGRQTFYSDGTGNEKKNAAPGEVFKMGSGHETGTNITPVINELTHYLQIRDAYFSASELGVEAASLTREAVQTVGVDANGKMAIEIRDRNDKLLMTARPGNSLQVTNTVLLNAQGMYSVVVNSANLVLGASGADPIIEVYAGATLFYSGPMTQLNLTGAPSQVEVRCAIPFGYQHCTNPPLNTNCTDPTNAGGGLQQIHYFQIFADNSDVTITGSYTLYNMATETSVSLLPGNKLNKGYYKLVATSGNVTLTYVNGYADISYHFYNQLGKVVASIAPEGVKRLLDPNSSANCVFNMSPVFSDIPNVGMQYGTQKTISIHATDADNNNLTITFPNLPAFATSTNIANGQANITFNPTLSTNQGNYTITANVSDGIAPLVSKNFTLVVKSSTNGAPIIANIQDVTVRNGFSVTVPITAWDPDGDNMTYAIPSLPYFATLVNLGNGRLNVVANPPQGEQGGFSMQFRATDQNGALSTKNFTIVVNDNAAPSLAAINNVYITEGQSTSINLVATDPEMSSFFVWTNSGLPSFATFTNNGNGNASIQISPGSTNAGYYPVTITVDDGFGSNVSRSFVIQVCDNAPITPDKTKVPFMSLYEYDVRGRLVKATTPDGGATELVYRKDGKLRFSQNAVQKVSGRYSYMNYDGAGRIVESGEYQPDGSGIAFTSDLSVSSPLKNILEDISSTGGLTTGTKKDVLINLFDKPDNSHAQSGYTQTAAHLATAISMTKKYSSIVNNVPNGANLVSASWYDYNAEGLLTWSIQYINGLGYKTIDYTYDGLNRLTKQVFQKNTAAETFVHYYEYDAGTYKLSKVYTNTVDNFGTKLLQATYIYKLDGGTKRLELAQNLQGVDYTYTLHGNLKAINNSDKTKDPGGDGPGNGFGVDAFGMVLDYFPDDYVNTRVSAQPIKGVNSSGIGTDSYQGNIKAMTWYSKKPVLPGVTDDPTTYVYQYDDKYQFTESTWGTNINFANTPATFSATAFNKESVKHPTNGSPGFDANGNILYLQRTDGTGTLTDRFDYKYYSNSNKLQSVVDDANLLPEVYSSYTYNQVGQLTLDNTGAASQKKFIKYDVAGKVVAVARDPQFTQLVAEYEYSETGSRIKKKLYNGSFQLMSITFYVGGVVYTQDVIGAGPIVAQEFAVNGGRGRIGTFYRQSPVYAYELTDHQGSVRAVIAQAVGSYEVRMYSDYYPFGMVLQKGGPDNPRYAYQGQHSEKDPETDWNAFEMRMYDAHIARWLSMDPYGQFNSPYVGMGNSPVNGIDPNGGFWEELANFLLAGMWISNEGLRMYNEYEANGKNPSYKWIGNRLTGHGVLYSRTIKRVWAVDLSTEGGWRLGDEIALKRQKIAAVEDFFYTDKLGDTYAIYVDLEWKATAGIRIALELEGVGGDINLWSTELWKYSFVEGHKSGFNEGQPFKFSQGLSVGVGILEGGFGVEYDKYVQDVETTFSGRIGVLDLSVVYKKMNETLAGQLGINIGGKIAFIAGIEMQGGLKQEAVPNGDRKAFMQNRD
jgi:RHS repeat-associated protein